LDELWNYPFEDLRGNPAGNLIENLLMLGEEMDVFGKQTYI
jgi:hypothetical protein